MKYRGMACVPIARLLLSVFALCAALAVAGCDDDDFVTKTWTVDLASQQQVLQRVGEGEASVYGWNRLTGETEIDGERVSVEMLGNVSYTRGNGPFFGFVTLTFPDGARLGLRMEGATTALPDTADAEFHGSLKVLGGTGAYTSATGTGRLDGTRQARLGGLVRMDFNVRLGGIGR